MNRYRESHTISMNEDEKVIKFTRKFERSSCEHKHIEVSVEENEVLCTDCNVRLNPIWWIEKYLKHINSATERNNRVLAEAREIYKKLEKKNSFLCLHCHEVNQIDFKRIISKASVTRGISIVESEHSGTTVEIER